MHDLLFIAIVAVIIGWLFLKKPKESSVGDTIALMEMFPGILEEDLRRDLARTRNTNATIENILAGRIPMRAPIPIKKEETIDLITEYNVNDNDKVETTLEWKDDRNERERLLKEYQKGMIMRARRKMKECN